MTRRALDESSILAADESSVPYQVWLEVSQIELIRKAHAQSGLSWPAWTQNAISRLSRESDEEIESLLGSWQSQRADKSLMSFRVLPSTLREAQKLAEKHSGTVQAVFAHAHFMEALAT